MYGVLLKLHRFALKLHLFNLTTKYSDIIPKVKLNVLLMDAPLRYP